MQLRAVKRAVARAEAYQPRSFCPRNDVDELGWPDSKLALASHRCFALPARFLSSARLFPILVSLPACRPLVLRVSTFASGQHSSLRAPLLYFISLVIQQAVFETITIVRLPLLLFLFLSSLPFLFLCLFLFLSLSFKRVWHLQCAAFVGRMLSLVCFLSLPL